MRRGVASAVASIPSGTYVAATGAVEKTGVLNLRDGFTSRTVAGDTGNGPITAKAIGNLSAGVIDWRHGGDFGFLLHMATGLAFAGPAATSALIGLGIGDGDGTTKNEGGLGLLVSNKKSGIGIKLIQNSTITAAGAYGIHLSQQSALAPGIFAQQDVSSAAPVATFSVAASTVPSATQRITDWYYLEGTAPGVVTLAGGMRAADGHLDWRRAVRTGNALGYQQYDNAATVRTVLSLNASNLLTIGDQNIASQPIDIAAGGNTDVQIKTNGSVRFTLNASGLTFAEGRNIIVGTTTGAKIGTGTTQKLGFWNATPVVQQARPTDAASIITLLTLLGLCA